MKNGDPQQPGETDDSEPEWETMSECECDQTASESVPEEAVLDLRPGQALEPGRLSSALLLAMRRRGGLHLADVAVAAGPAVGERALEDGLDEAWRTACALNLPLGEDVKGSVMRRLINFRYVLSRVDPASDAPPAADALVRWRELWRRVDLLLEYARRLQDELQALQGHDRAPGSADKSVMLARMCALAVHNVKGSFAASYKDVPWEEMEYLLVMFIEARTVPVTLAHAAATASRIAAHLRCFRERLEKYVLVHRAEPDPVAAMKRLKKEPRKERAALLGGVVDSALTELRKDFALLRDWHSLKEINETLGVANEVLRLEDDAWSAWGWLSLRWALFVVGERMKYSWTSPNLSPRWAVLMEAMAPGGFLKVMKDIRNYQEHGDEGTNAKTLALSDMRQPERKRLTEELGKLGNAARAALVDVENLVPDGVDIDWYWTFRVNATKRRGEYFGNAIVKEVIKVLAPAKTKARKEFDEIVALSEKVNKQKTIPNGPSGAPLLLSKYESLLWTVNFNNFMTLSLQFAHAHACRLFPRVSRLFLSKSAEQLECFHSDLEQVSPEVENSPLKTLVRALKYINSALLAKQSMLGTQMDRCIDFALRGAWRELASRWHERDQVVATAVPFSPALFGRQLRNYLNHLDEVFASSSGTEMWAFQALLGTALLPVEPNGAMPRLRDLRWSRAENERLLRLAELKSDMFRCAREGHLFWLQRLVEDGADVSARDCQDRTLLHAAAQGGQVHVVRWLLGLGAEAVDPLAEDWCGHTALHVARTAAVAEELLVASPGQWKRDDAYTPLHTAALEGRAEVAAVLLRDRRGLHVERNGRTPLHGAARGGHDQVVRLLLQAGARCQALGEAGAPLVAAASSGSVATVRLLLGASPRPTDEDCWESARSAAEWGHDQALSVLLDELSTRGRLEWGVDARLVLTGVVRGGSVAVVFKLLDCFPEALTETLTDDGVTTILQVSVAFGRSDLVRSLIERGTDPLYNIGAALFMAAASGSLETIDVLVELGGADGPLLRAALGEALVAAAQLGHLEAVQRLVHHGADVVALPQEGYTTLGAAALSGHSDVVRWLLLQGADPCLGKLLPLHLAAGWCRLGVVKVLVPPLHASALAVAVKARVEGSAAVKEDARGVLERILRWVVAHLRPLSSSPGSTSADRGPTSSTYSRGDRRREEAENKAVLQWKEKEEQERLRLLQQVNSDGSTALHLAAAASALPVVEYLLEREGELLRRVYSKHKNTGVPRLDGLSVYARNATGWTALQLGGAMLCAPSVAEALLKRMADEVWMALGSKDLKGVRRMALEALEVAAVQSGGDRLVDALCDWIRRSREGLLNEEERQYRDPQCFVALRINGVPFGYDYFAGP